MIRRIVAAAFLISIATARAGDSPPSLVFVVPQEAYSNVSDKVGDILVGQWRVEDTAANRAWLLDGWCRFLRAADSAPVLVYCDSFLHLEAGGVRLTAERIEKLKAALKPLAIEVHTTTEPAVLYAALGLTEEAPPEWADPAGVIGPMTAEGGTAQ